MTTPQTPDPVPSDDLARDSKVPDDGPVLDTGPSSIEVERGKADEHEPKPAVPPEAELPPD